MQLVNEWFYFNNTISKEICEDIKNLSNGSFESATVDVHKVTTEEERRIGRKADYALDKKSRLSDISWTSDQLIIDLVWPYMVKANKQAGWNFDITAVESMQITKYKPDGFYNWHRDGGSDCLSKHNKPDNKFLHGKVRKLSMTVLLNENYQGGEFQFAHYSKLDNKVETPDFKNAGSVIVFPSFMEHRVAPVTKGTRYSLVAWFVGPPFK